MQADAALSTFKGKPGLVFCFGLRGEVAEFRVPFHFQNGIFFFYCKKKLLLSLWCRSESSRECEDEVGQPPGEFPSFNFKLQPHVPARSSYCLCAFRISKKRMCISDRPRTRDGIQVLTILSIFAA